jgi:hypothetical protein
MVLDSEADVCEHLHRLGREPFFYEFV